MLKISISVEFFRKITWIDTIIFSDIHPPPPSTIVILWITSDASSYVNGLPLYCTSARNSPFMIFSVALTEVLPEFVFLPLNFIFYMQHEFCIMRQYHSSAVAKHEQSIFFLFEL